MKKWGLTGHENARHVLVATGDGDHTIQVVATSSSLDLVGNEVSRLERVPHSSSTHADSVANSNGAELVANQSRLDQGRLDFLAQPEEMFVASCEPSMVRKRVACGGQGDSRVAFIP